MARRMYEGTELLPGLVPEGEEEEVSTAAPSRSRAKAEAPKRPLSTFRLSMRLVALTLAAVTSLLGAYELERFLIRDPRFTLPAADFGPDSPNVRIEGLHHASRDDVMRIFAPDLGRSLYLMPLAARRAALLGIDWVKDASVARIWPNRVLVRVKERTPAAFLLVGSGNASRYALIDDEGVILRPPAYARFTLPVAVGIRPDEPITLRRDRVRRMMRMLQELGPLGEKISEVDVSERDNLKVTESVDNRAVTLVLGDRNFAVRMRNFVNHYAEIRKRLPDATRLDLRLEDRITVEE